MPRTIHIDLSGFTWPELMVLVHHLEYAADRLQLELDGLRRAQCQHCFYPQHSKGGPQGLLISHWAGLIRDKRYFTRLARALEETLADWQAVFFISDGSPPRLDLAGLPARDNGPLLLFLERERERARLAVAYLQRETFDERVKQDLLLALELEIRFFGLLLERLHQVPPSCSSPSLPARDYVPLIFVSLPRVLIDRPTRTAPRPQVA